MKKEGKRIRILLSRRLTGTTRSCKTISWSSHFEFLRKSLEKRAIFEADMTKLPFYRSLAIILLEEGSLVA